MGAKTFNSVVTRFIALAHCYLRQTDGFRYIIQYILLWILATLLLGLASIVVSLGHRDGGVMVLLGQWAQHIVTFRGGAADFISGVHWLYKTHIVFGITLFVLFPFSRLVHVWSGFATVGYLTRAYQIVRSRALKTQ